MDQAGILRTASGRVRLGWRLLAFVVLAVLITIPASLLPFPSSELGSGFHGPLIGCLVAGWVLLRLDGRGPGALGFYLSRDAFPESLGGLALGSAVTLLGIALIAGMGGLRWASDPGGLAEYGLGAGWALWVFAVPAAVEEALLRGYPLQALADSWGSSPALWVTAVVFAALHLGNPNVSALGIANIVVAGLFLGVIYLKTASLWWATGAHLGWNWSEAYLADLPVSGLEEIDAPLIEPVIRDPAWLSGGSFGPEASVVTTVVVALATFVLWNSNWLTMSEAARKTRPIVLGVGDGGGPYSDESGRER